MLGQIVQCSRCRTLLHQPPGAPCFYCVCGLFLQTTYVQPQPPPFPYLIPPTNLSNWPQPIAPGPINHPTFPARVGPPAHAPPTNAPPNAPVEERNFTPPGSPTHSPTGAPLAAPSQQSAPVMLTHVGQPSLPAGNLPVQKNQVSAVLVQSTPHISGTSIPVPSTPHVSAISASTQGTPRAAVTCVPVQPVSPASSNPVPATPVNVPVSVPVNVPGQYSGGPQTKSGSAMDMLKGIVTLAAKGVGQSLGVWTPTDVVVNGARLTSQEIQQLRMSGVFVRDGRYWYDHLCGAYGNEGGAFKGFITPGLPIGPPLRSDASNGTSGVFINGRQLATSDVVRLQMAGVPAIRGRWWMNGSLQYGAEGNFVPLGQLPKQGGGYGGHGGSSSFWRSNIDSHTYGGSNADGNFYVAGDGWSVANF